MITAKSVAELRARTGAGMMDCKKALEETNGDMDAAADLLRKKGIAKADKRADRAASDGQIVIWTSPDAKTGAMIELNCETDFVGRNEEFVALAKQVVAHVGQDAALDGIVDVGEHPAGNTTEECGTEGGSLLDRGRLERQSEDRGKKTQPGR